MGVVDRLISGLLGVARWLALPIALCLFLQWPLRDWIQHGSREANDLGQWLFALFVAAGIVAATRASRHIGTDVISAGLSPSMRRWLERLGNLVALLPWALFVLWAAMPQIIDSVMRLERFADTANPAYFMVKVALGLMLTLMAAQAVVDLFRGDPS